MKKILLTALGVIALALIGAASYVKFALPNVGPAPDIKISTAPENIQHGAYLANHVAVCMDCHSTRDWSRFAGPPEAGTLGKGGEFFGPEMGFPGKFYSRNLTPANLKDWTDGEIFRAITSGVDKDGKALFPVMPYPYYGKMDKQDVYDIIAYLRSLPPIQNNIPPSKASFPMNFIMNTIPTKPNFTKRPNKTEVIAYGGYLVNMAGCVECHTQADHGQIVPEMAFAGGRVFEMPDGTLRSANITQDQETGIGKWTEEEFINRFTTYKNPSALPKMEKGEVNTVMPWPMYAGMDTTDLEAVYAYLKTIKPIKNQVEHFSPNR